MTLHCFHAIKRLHISSHLVFSTQLYTHSIHHSSTAANGTKLWLGQAKNQLNLMHKLLHSLTFQPETSSHVCYLSHQVATFSLKAANCALQINNNSNTVTMTTSACASVQREEKECNDINDLVLHTTGLSSLNISTLQAITVNSQSCDATVDSSSCTSSCLITDAIAAIERADQLYTDIEMFIKSFQAQKEL